MIPDRAAHVEILALREPQHLGIELWGLVQSSTMMLVDDFHQAGNSSRNVEAVHPVAGTDASQILRPMLDENAPCRRSIGDINSGVEQKAEIGTCERTLAPKPGAAHPLCGNGG